VEEEFFKILSSHKFFSASFFQRTSNNEQERNIQGKIIADRSGRFKLNYFEPLNEIIFSDGKDLYRYDPELDQAYVQPLDDLLKETPLGLFVLSTEELKQFLSLDWCKDIKSFMRCRLSSLRDISFVREIVVELKDKAIHQLSYRDTFNQNVTLIFNNPSTEKIAPGQFQVIIPKGTDIVRFKNTLE
tara:strand:+ start:363 stop:923 length:561 start_codon:yes stop_codon:yes gene_type:complete